MGREEAASEPSKSARGEEKKKKEKNPKEEKTSPRPPKSIQAFVEVKMEQSSSPEL